MHKEVAKFEAQMALFNTDGGSAHCAQYTVHSAQCAVRASPQAADAKKAQPGLFITVEVGCTDKRQNRHFSAICRNRRKPE